MDFFKRLFLVLVLFCSGQVLAVPEVGTDYLSVNPPQPTASKTKIEVLEFFYYPCSHCYKLDLFLGAWEKTMPKDIQFIYESAVFGDGMEPIALTFYALDSINQRKRLHDALFKAIHIDNMDLNDEAALTNFVVKQGVDRKIFSAAYNAPATKTKVMRSKKMSVDYNLRGTPTLIVDGRYMIYGLTPEKTLEMLDFLVKKVRKERAGKKI